MAHHNISQSKDCVATTFFQFNIAVGFIILPFHFLMIKVMIIDLRLALPRHLIVFCLSISDTLQSFVPFFTSVVGKMFSFTMESDGCLITFDLLYFALTATLVVSSVSIIVLSFERYVACIHSFRLHEIFTRERMVYGLTFLWISGMIFGTVAVVLGRVDKLTVILDADRFMMIVNVMLVFPTSIVISVIQCRLLIFSRKKLMRVGDTGMFGREAESADMKKKQIKIAFVACIIAIAYIMCMFPLAVLSLYELIYGRIPARSVPVMLRALALLNNLADPYIYGFGVVDSRKAIAKNFRRLRDFLARK